MTFPNRSWSHESDKPTNNSKKKLWKTSKRIPMMIQRIPPTTKRAFFLGDCCSYHAAYLSRNPVRESIAPDSMYSGRRWSWWDQGRVLSDRRSLAVCTTYGRIYGSDGTNLYEANGYLCGVGKNLVARFSDKSLSLSLGWSAFLDKALWYLATWYLYCNAMDFAKHIVRGT